VVYNGGAFPANKVRCGCCTVCSLCFQYWVAFAGCVKSSWSVICCMQHAQHTHSAKSQRAGSFWRAGFRHLQQRRLPSEQGELSATVEPLKGLFLYAVALAGFVESCWSVVCLCSVHNVLIRRNCQELDSVIYNGGAFPANKVRRSCQFAFAYVVLGCTACTA
jgi:hypothetical protein